MSKHNKQFIILISIIFAILITLAFTNSWLLRLSNADLSDNYHLAMNIVNGISATGLFILITVEIVSLFIDKNASKLTVFAIIFMFISYVLSKDFITFTRLFNMDLPSNDVISKTLHFFSCFFATLAILSIMLHIDTQYPVQISKNMRIAVYLSIFLTSFLSLVEVGVFIHIAFILIVFIIHTVRIAFYHRLTLFWLFESLILIILLTIEVINSLDSKMHNNSYYCYVLVACSYILVIGLFIAIYTNYVIQQSIQLKRSDDNEARLQKLQNSVLKNQMSPHFIFNAIANIKGTYAIDNAKGDKSIDYLSSYLRTYLSSKDTYIVPFTKEMEVIENYLAIINLKFNEPFNVIYDIDVSNFDIVYFGLQPFIENAIKYSNIKQKEDGHIIISTKEDEDAYTVIISDNGDGFDPNDISDKSYGIINTVERFKLLQNASVKIRSKIGEGCEVTISIPKVQ